MGYFANYGGRIKTKCLTKDEERKIVHDLNAEEFLDLDYLPCPSAFENFDIFIEESGEQGNKSYAFEMYGNDKYHEDDVVGFLMKVKPFVETGEIKYCGEDGTHWRFIFRSGNWYEENGEVVYIENTEPVYYEE